MLHFRPFTLALLLGGFALAGCSGGGGASASLPRLTAAGSASGAAAPASVPIATVANVVASTEPTLLPSATAATSGLSLDASTTLSTGTPVFSDTFANVAVGAADPNWAIGGGTWRVCAPTGAHEYCAAGDNNIAAAGSASWTDYHLDAVVVPDTGTNGVAIIGRMHDAGHFYQLELRNDYSGSGKEMWYLWRFDGGWRLLKGGPLQLDTTNSYKLRLGFSGTTISAAVAYDGQPTFHALGSATDTAFAKGNVALRSWGTSKGRFSNVAVTLDGAVATPTPTPSPVSSAPPSHPTSTPMPAPTATPVAASGYSESGQRYPAAGTFTYFPSSLMLANYSPTIDANDAAWKSKNSITGFDSIRVATGDGGTADAGYKYDPGEPLYYCTPGAPGCVKYAMNCTQYTVNCTNGTPFWCPAKAVPQGINDAHVTCIDEQSGLVTSLWAATSNPGSGGGTWSSGAGVQCSLSGNAQNCGSTASNIPVAVGLVKASDLQSGAYTLPYAIQTAVKCEAPPQMGLVAPATWGDGSTAGCPPSGQRIFLFGYTAAQIDATSNPEWAKKILRTMLVGSHGLVLTDTNPYAGIDGGGGISIQPESALSYTQFGMANPWKPIIASDSANLGQTPPPGTADLGIPHAGIDLADNLHFADV